MAENSDVFEEIDLKNILDNKYLKQYWHYGVLGVIFLLALWVRLMPGKQGIFIGIDPFYLSRMTETLVNNAFNLPHNDPLRYAPTGWDPHNEVMGIFYIPAVIYYLLNSVFPLDFHTFAMNFPAVVGALIVIPIFLIGRELHNKYTGLFAAFFYTFSSSVLFRTSAGFFEKESIAGFLMLFGLYYFIRAIKDDSLSSGLIAGLSIAAMATVWGGVQQILLGIVGYMFLVILLNKQTLSHLKAYAPIVFISVTYYGTGSSIAKMNYLAFALLVARFAVEKYGYLTKERLPYFGPGAIFGGGFAVLIGALFSPALASLVNSTQKFLFYSKEVIESTVAENQDSGWTDFISQFGVDASKAYFPSMSSILPYGAMWILAFGAVFIILHKIYKEKDVYYMAGMLLAFVSFVSYHLFMKAVSDPIVRAKMQMVYVFSFMLLLVIVARKDHIQSMMLLLMFSSMLGFASKVRFGFILGPYMALMAGYFVSNFISFVGGTKLMREAKDITQKINVYSIFSLIFIGLVVIANASAGYTIGKSMEVGGPSFTSNWQEAMEFLRTNTTEDSVILSWWDFGYWFQTMGERPTNLDGGNNKATRNRPTAQFFTGMMNESQQKYYLNRFGTDYILVDYSMIGKYAAMSKIANYGEKVEAYMTMPYVKNIEQDDVTVIIYSAGQYNLWVPINNMGQLEGNIVLSSSMGQEAYVKSICSPDGVIELDPPNDKPIIDSCVFITQNLVYFASEDVGTSELSKLFFMDGKGMDYVEKVFDNGEVKIFKVTLEKADHDELLQWWGEHNELELLVK